MGVAALLHLSIRYDSLVRAGELLFGCAAARSVRTGMGSRWRRGAEVGLLAWSTSSSGCNALLRARSP